MAEPDKQKDPPPSHGGPPWVNPTIQSKIDWRDDDVVVSVPSKSGTTWTMNIVHQLRTKGDCNFDDIYHEVKWIEVMDTPESTVDDMVKKINDMDTTKPRTFKSHKSPPTLPFHDKIKYVVVVRNPEEAIISMRVFLSKHSPKFLEHWGSPPMNFPDVESFYNAFVKGGGGFGKGLFEFANEWWKLRDKDNVLMLHYSDMKSDHEGSIKKISDFLDFGSYTDDEWNNILKYTSFDWMKRHESKFEGSTIWNPPAIMSGGMLRQGSSGLAREEGMNEEMAADLREQGKAILKDEKAFDWFYNGGEL